MSTIGKKVRDVELECGRPLADVLVALLASRQVRRQLAAGADRAELLASVLDLPVPLVARCLRSLTPPPRAPRRRRQPEPSATRADQVRRSWDARGDARIVEHEGRRMTLAAWAREVGQPYARVHARLTLLGWSPQMALLAPSRRAPL